MPRVFPSGVTEILSEPAFFDDVLEYDGKYYKVGTKRDAVMENKTVNDVGKMMVVVDIGSWTIDIIPIVDGKPDEANANTIAEGLIPCMRRINKQCMRLYNEKIDEEIIKHYIITHKSDLDEKFVKIMDDNLKAFATNLFNSLREEGYSHSTTQFCFTCGGATVMKHFGGYNQKNITYLLDVHANAKGYETMTKAALERKARA